MTEQEAIKLLKSKIRTDSFDETFEEIQMDCALTMAIEALEKQIALEKVIEQIEELANVFQEDKQYEVHCKDRCYGCSDKDCCSCALERAIEIIKQEMM